MGWILGVVVLLCAAGVVCNWVMQVKEERKRQACEQERLRRKRRKQKQQANGKRASVSSASDSDIDSTSPPLENACVNLVADLIRTSLGYSCQPAAHTGP